MRKLFSHGWVITTATMFLVLLGGEDLRDNAKSVARDKSGTNALLKLPRAPQPAHPQRVAEHGSFQTERGGFEPPWRFKPPTAFPVLLLQPLGHLSKEATIIGPGTDQTS